MTRRKRRSHTEWQTLIQQQKESGQSVTLFCQYQNLSSKTFYKHQRELHADEILNITSSAFIKINKSSNPSSSAVAEPACILHYQNCQLQIQSTVDANWIAKIMVALS